jgi:hypothetical protein
MMMMMIIIIIIIIYPASAVDLNGGGILVSLFEPQNV